MTSFYELIKKYLFTKFKKSRSSRFIPEKVLFSGGSSNQEDSLWLNGSLPGQKIMPLAKKGGGSSFLRAGFRRFSPAIPLPPRLFAETKKGDSLSFRPALFVFGA